MNSFEQNSPNESLVEKYRPEADEEGYVFTSAFAVPELGRQNKNVAALLDGEEGTAEYNLGEGLRYKGGSGNYSEMKIHVDDLDIFIQRVRDYFGGGR